MSNTTLEDNLQSLPQYLKDLVAEMDMDGDAQTKIQIIQGNKGFPVALLSFGNGTVHSNSLVDPWLEAEVWAETLEYKNIRLHFIYGCGLGYPLLEYAKRKKPYTETIIFERNINLFYAMLSCMDVRSLLNDPTIHFLVGDQQQMISQFSTFMNGELLLISTMLSSSFTWLAHRIEKQTYMQIHEWIWNLLALFSVNIGNTVHDTLVGLYNTLDNAGKIIESPALSSLRNAFAGKPAFIVSNGPSLDKNADRLVNAVGKSLIITAESALLPCLRRNIQPDAVCVLERSSNSYHLLFEREKLPTDLVLVGLSLIDPRIPQSIDCPWIPVFRRGEHSAQWVREAIMEDKAELLGGATSAHLAFEFALWVGADPIIFVGQDLAFGHDNATHSKLSIYAEDDTSTWTQYLYTQPSFFVPGVDGQPVLTSKTWFDFKTWFENQIRLYPSRTFIDATEGGALIQGTRLVSLQEAIEAYCKTPLEQTLAQYVQSIADDKVKHFTKEKYETLLQRLRQVRDNMVHLSIIADKDIQNCRLIERACHLHAKYPETEIPAFITDLVIQNISAHQKYTDDTYISTFVQHVVFAFHKQINDLGEIDTVERIRDVTQLHLNMIMYIKRIFELVTEQFIAVEERLTERYFSEHEHK
ncbi:motility associated factor glycosyltransferase family protein [Paenibacillus sp. FSL H8-0034]|uniref:motility associated factor glycosyltransferase family protein n=1 Tax=Paenibacillus sp. FSL H8-0034 TaxID=2954671 RepID=UPI0030FBA92F